MKTFRELVSAVLIGGAALALSSHALASEATVVCTAGSTPTAAVEFADEIVVYGKRSAVRVELDRAALRIDVRLQRRLVSASLERSRARAEDAVSVATADNRPRG
jgi:hypothetical protein